MPVSARLLGAPGLEHEGSWIEPAPGKTGALLYYLVHRGGWVSRDEVLGLLWPDHDEVRARSSFRQLLTAVRRLTFTEGLEIERTRLRWPLTSDLAAFRSAVDRGENDEAVALYRGAFLEGFRTPGLAEFESWLQLERDLLQSLWREAALASAAGLEAAGEHGAALGVLERLCRAEPFDEEALRARIRCLTVLSRSAEAIETFAAFERLLREELASEPSPATRRLIERLRSGASPEVPIVAEERFNRSALQAQLPVAPTPFVGRMRELRELAGLLDDPARRLVTVVGPGGIGKTRLALEAARTMGERYRDGGAFVPLGALEAIELVPTAIASTLGLILTGDDPLAALTRTLRERELLLVLDNLEQFPRVERLDALLAGVPRLQLLVTSRRRLDLRAEWLYELGGLALSPEGDAGDGTGGEAVALFVQAARRVRGGFSLGAEGAADADRIVRAVAGMPLALELAASWLRTLSLAELANEVEGGLDLLHTTARDVPDRHRSVRATFDRSWERLDSEERRILPCFAPFRGGFDREAVAAVTGGSLAILTGLVDRSFLQVVAGGRFDLHPLMAEYLRERLERSGKVGRVRERHGLHYLDLVGRLHAYLWGRTREAFVRWSLERGNVRAAWLWAVEAGRGAQIRAAVLPLTTLFRLDARASASEAYELLAVAGERFEGADPVLEGALLIGRADLDTELGRYGRAHRLALRGLTLLRGLDPALEVIGEIIVGSFHEDHDRGQRSAVERALALADRLDEPLRSTLTARVIHREQFAADARGDREVAERLQRRMHDLYVEVGYGPGIVATTMGRGWSALYRGAFREAERHATRGAEVAREYRDGFREDAEQWMIRARAAYGLERFADAKAYAHRSLQELERTDAISERAIMLASAGRACARLGAFREGERYLRDALVLAWELNRMPSIFLEALVYLAELRAEQDRHERAAALAGLVLAHPLTRAWNREQAEALLTRLAASHDAAGLDAARRRGERLDLERLVGGLMATLGGDPASER